MTNEFRQDLVSGDWVLIASGRAKRPVEISKPEEKQQAANGFCPFDDPKASGQEIVSEYAKPSGDKWLTVIKNKYPAVSPGRCLPLEKSGPFFFTAASGHHEVVISADHKRNFQEFSIEETELVLKAFQDRFLEISKYDCADYIQIFNNSGRESGASIGHPHSQILSTPIIPPMVSRSITGAHDYFKKNNKRAHEVTLAWESEQKKRIIFENELFVALCPFVSKMPYEIKIFPKKANAHFEKSSSDDLKDCAEALNFSLARLNSLFEDELSYNFFIHTAPVKGEMSQGSSDFYHWHIEIMPHFSTLGGLDFSTGVIVNVIDPDEAAQALRKA